MPSISMRRCSRKAPWTPTWTTPSSTGKAGREQALRDVITKLEPELFKKVTGLSKDDFELLLSLNVLQRPLESTPLSACPISARKAHICDKPENYPRDRSIP